MRNGWQRLGFGIHLCQGFPVRDSPAACHALRPIPPPSNRTCSCSRIQLSWKLLPPVGHLKLLSQSRVFSTAPLPCSILGPHSDVHLHWNGGVGRVCKPDLPDDRQLPLQNAAITARWGTWLKATLFSIAHRSLFLQKTIIIFRNRSRLTVIGSQLKKQRAKGSHGILYWNQYPKYFNRCIVHWKKLWTDNYERLLHF